MTEHSKRSIEKYYAERTKRIVQRFLPASPAVVADVGGGTGPYSFWPAGLSYEVCLVEPAVRRAKICKGRMKPILGCPDREPWRSGTHGRCGSPTIPATRC